MPSVVPRPWLPYYQNCHFSNDKTLGANILGRQLWLQHMGSGWFFWFLKLQFWSWPERADWEAPLPLKHLHRLWFLGPRNPAGGAPPKSFMRKQTETFPFHSLLTLIQGPAVGRGIAELLLDGAFSSLDLTALSFDRCYLHRQIKIRKSERQTNKCAKNCLHYNFAF